LKAAWWISKIFIIYKTNTGPRAKKAWGRQRNDTKTTRKKTPPVAFHWRSVLEPCRIVLENCRCTRSRSTWC